ncbi:MAG: hypothetical protein AB8F26_07940 [Phycisphaerales bacterium]
MLVRFLVAVLVFLALGVECRAGAVHPQDGPHADLRVAIEDDLVRFSIGVNLAFLDEAIDAPREALGEISDPEAERTLNDFRELLLEQATCVVNGRPIQPVFERLEIFTNPDPGMIAVFPKMGNRALIRATAIMRFDAPSITDTVEITWPVYPVDQLAEQLEGGLGAAPRMYFEAVFTANGKSSSARFTGAEPTIRWSRAGSSPADLLLDLPQPIVAELHSGAPWRYLSFGGAAIAAIGLGLMRRSTHIRMVVGTTFFVFIALGFTLPMHKPAGPIVAESDAQKILLSIHENMYRAFDYTAESDIYDRLSLALEGDLLGDLYEQIRLSLLQAEEEMKVGVVTGLEPIATTIDSIDLSAPSAVGLGFDATHRWRVDGTVYHWGHSHTRAHVYEATYRVEFTDTGWRITEHRLLSQQRIDPGAGTLFQQSDPSLRAIEQLEQSDI